MRRTRTGLIAHDPARALQGYTLFAPMFGDGTVYLVDMEGAVVHAWRLPHRPGAYGYLLDDGHLFYSGKVMDGVKRFAAWERFKAGAALEVDWSGKVVWEIRHPDHHHDARKLRNGNVMLLCLRPMPTALQARVKGGLAGSEIDGTIYADYLVEMTTAGDVVWEWRSWEHLDFETEIITLQDDREEWTHGNTVAELPDGNWWSASATSRRSSSSIAAPAPSSGSSAARPWPSSTIPARYPTESPHLRQRPPPPRSSGAILPGDRGRPRTSAIVWESTISRYSTSSARTSRAPRRLPNGNTLICEGCDGRIFEVTTTARSCGST